MLHCACSKTANWSPPTYSHFDSVILSQTQSRWLKVARVIGYAMVESSDSTIMQVGDLYLGGRVAALVDAGHTRGPGQPPELAT